MKAEKDRKRAVRDFYTEYLKSLAEKIVNSPSNPSSPWAAGHTKGGMGISPLSTCLTPGEGLVRIETRISNILP